MIKTFALEHSLPTAARTVVLWAVQQQPWHQLRLHLQEPALGNLQLYVMASVVYMVVHAADLHPFDGAHLSGCQLGTRFIISVVDNGEDDFQVLPEAG